MRCVFISRHISDQTYIFSISTNQITFQLQNGVDGAADICSHHGCRSSTQHATFTSSTCVNKFRYLKEHRIKLSGTEIQKPSADEFYASILPECSIQYNYLPKPTSRRYDLHAPRGPLSSHVSVFPNFLTNLRTSKKAPRSPP